MGDTKEYSRHFTNIEQDFCEVKKDDKLKDKAAFDWGGTWFWVHASS